MRWCIFPPRDPGGVLFFVPQGLLSSGESARELLLVVLNIIQHFPERRQAATLRPARATAQVEAPSPALTHSPTMKRHAYSFTHLSQSELQ